MIWEIRFMRSTIRKLSILLVIGFGVSACGSALFTEPATNPVIEDRVGVFYDEQVGTLATTASRRTVIVRLQDHNTAPDGIDRTGWFCAEPSPDASENLVASFGALLEAEVKQPEGPSGKGAVEVSRNLATSIQSLVKRSQGLQLYRDGMYNLCQAYVNGIMGQDEFLQEQGKLRDTASELIKFELEKNNGQIGHPPAATELPESILRHLKTVSH